MPANRPNPRRAKLHRSYSVAEIAALYAVHRNTVRAWIKRGLPTIDKQLPLLVLGADLVAFMQQRRTVNRRRCQPGEIYCMRCREPRRPADCLVHYLPLTPTQGNLVGLCGCCGAQQYRRTSLATLGAFAAGLKVTMPQAWQHIDESAQPTANSELKQHEASHAHAQP